MPLDAPPRTPGRPNVIWIFGDQHRAQACGYAGDPNLHTPNLDRLACEGVIFNGVAGFPLCCAYRGSLLTGRYPHACVPGHECQMPPGMPTVAHAFRAGGYDTAYLGKWHVDGFQERTGRAAWHIVPPERRGGFDLWVGYENNNSPWDCWVHGPAAFLAGRPGTESARDVGTGDLHYRLPGYETDALTDLLIAYLERQQQARAGGTGRPFFAALSVQPPHDPFMAPPEWMGRHTPAGVTLRANVPPVEWIVQRARRNLAGYYAAIENLDWNVGRVRAALARLGLADDTLLVFFSDHGELAGSHGQFAKMSPYEEAIRVPMLVGGGVPFYGVRRGFAAGEGQSAVLVNHVDLAPTTLGLCGLEAPADMQGTDYSAHFRLDRPTRTEPDSAFLQVVVPTGHGNSVDRPWRGVVTRDGWKYVALEGQPLMLFNLRDDPYELANHAFNPRFRAERRTLQDRLAQWIADTGDRFRLPEL